MREEIELWYDVAVGREDRYVFRRDTDDTSEMLLLFESGKSDQLLLLALPFLERLAPSRDISTSPLEALNASSSLTDSNSKKSLYGSRALLTSWILSTACGESVEMF